jgi:hypothetical protein
MAKRVLSHSNAPSSTSGEMTDPKTGKRLRSRDMREKFARISARVPRNPRAERAFVESKVEMIRSHPTLSEAQKASAIRDLEKMLAGKGRASGKD